MITIRWELRYDQQTLCAGVQWYMTMHVDKGVDDVIDYAIILKALGQNLESA